MSDHVPTSLSWKFPTYGDFYWDRSAFLRVLSGQIDCLVDCFQWCEAPEGADYWNTRCRGSVPLSVRDKEQLMIWFAVFPRS